MTNQQANIDSILFDLDLAYRKYDPYFRKQDSAQAAALSEAAQACLQYAATLQALKYFGPIDRPATGVLKAEMATIHKALEGAMKRLNPFIQGPARAMFTRWEKDASLANEKYFFALGENLLSNAVFQQALIPKLKKGRRRKDAVVTVLERAIEAGFTLDALAKEISRERALHSLRTNVPALKGAWRTLLKTRKQAK
jgi:hypothetical protein